MPAPDLHGGAWIAHEGRDGPGASLFDPVRLVGRPLSAPPGRSPRAVRGRSGPPPDRRRGSSGRPASGDVRVDEEEAEARVGEVLLDAAAESRPAAPSATDATDRGAIGALRQASSRPGHDRRGAGARRSPDRELEPDALVPREQRQEPVGRRRADDLDPPRRLAAQRNAPMRSPPSSLEQPAQPVHASPPEARPAAGGVPSPLAARVARGLVAGHEPLVEEGLQLGREIRDGPADSPGRA